MADKKILLVDIDETVFPLMACVLDAYNTKYGMRLKLDDITDYDVTRFLHDRSLNIFKEFTSREMFQSAKPIGKSVEVLCEVNQIYDVYFATAGYPETMVYRDEWLKDHFSFYNTNRLVMSRNKHLLRGHGLIDDYIGNLIGEKTYESIVFTMPWNSNIDDKENNLHRMNSWDENSVKFIMEVLGDAPIPKKHRRNFPHF